MSRHGYSDCCDGWELICWRGAVASAIRGRRGQKLLRELLAALDAMPDKYLCSQELVTEEGEVCALGSLAKAKGTLEEWRDVDTSYDVSDDLAEHFDGARALIKEIQFVNDECAPSDGYNRFHYVRAWVAKQILPEKEAKS